MSIALMYATPDIKPSDFIGQSSFSVTDNESQYQARQSSCDFQPGYGSARHKQIKGDNNSKGCFLYKDAYRYRD